MTSLYKSKYHWICECQTCDCLSDCKHVTGFIIPSKFSICYGCGTLHKTMKTKYTLKARRVFNPYNVSKDEINMFLKEIKGEEIKTEKETENIFIKKNFLNKEEAGHLISQLNKELDLEGVWDWD